MNGLMIYQTKAIVSEALEELTDDKYTTNDTITLVVTDLMANTEKVIQRIIAGKQLNIKARLNIMSLEKLFNGYVPDKEFDYVVGNPPYNGTAALHQRVFNISLDMLKEGGTIKFIQPATPYLNKKEKKKSHEQKMMDNLEKYQVEVKLVPPSYFPNAQISTELAITTLTKTESKTKNINRVEYIDGSVYTNVNLKDINMGQIEPELYGSIKRKYFKYINNNDSLYEISERNIENGINAVTIATIRGHRNDSGLKSDYYTFMSSIDYVKEEDIKHGILCNKSENKSVRNYLTTKFARYGLSMYKFNTNMHGGELRSVPKVPFNKMWTDEELFDLIGLTKKERKIITNYIPDYTYE